MKYQPKILRLFVVEITSMQTLFNRIAILIIFLFILFSGLIGFVDLTSEQISNINEFMLAEMAGVVTLLSSVLFVINLNRDYKLGKYKRYLSNGFTYHDIFQMIIIKSILIILLTIIFYFTISILFNYFIWKHLPYHISWELLSYFILSTLFLCGFFAVFLLLFRNLLLTFFIYLTFTFIEVYLIRIIHIGNSKYLPFQSILQYRTTHHIEIIIYGYIILFYAVSYFILAQIRHWAK